MVFLPFHSFALRHIGVVIVLCCRLCTGCGSEGLTALPPAAVAAVSLNHRSRLTRALSISFMNAVEDGAPQDLLMELRTPMIAAALLSPPAAASGVGGMSVSAAAASGSGGTSIGKVLAPHASGMNVFGCECSECLHLVTDVMSEVRGGEGCVCWCRN